MKMFSSRVDSKRVPTYELTVLLLTVLIFALYFHCCTKNDSLEKNVRHKTEDDSVVLSQFLRFMIKYNKTYGPREYRTRLNNFKRFLKRVEKRNRPYIKTNSTPAHGITKFADMSEKEFRRTYLSCPTEDNALKCNNRKLKICKDVLISEDIHGDVLNKTVDWRKCGYVGDVVRQGKCCGCWAASIVGVMETMAAKKQKYFQQFSIQRLIDCDDDTLHCGGGNVMSALNYMCLKDMEMAKAEEYEDTWVDGQCRDIEVHGRWKLYGYTYFCGLSVNSTLRLLEQNGPLVVQVNAYVWDSYIGGGVLQWHCSDDPSLANHAVQLVGYNLDAVVPYYIVRNSWGKDFGEDGYLRLQIAGNVCGVRNIVTILNVTK